MVVLNYIKYPVNLSILLLNNLLKIPLMSDLMTADLMTADLMADLFYLTGFSLLCYENLIKP